MKVKTLSIFLILLCFAPLLRAQDLDLDQLIKMVLENNLEIRLEKNEFRNVDNLAKPGQVGLLPEFALTGSAGYSRNNTSLEFAGELPAVEVDGAENINYGASLGMNYVLFNGFQRVNTLESLKTNKQLSLLQVQALTEAYVLEAVYAYLDHALLLKNVEIAITGLEISRRRLKTANLAYENGSRTKIDQLNAEIDYNNDSLSLLRSYNAVLNKKYDINLLLGMPPDGELQLSENVPVPLDVEKPDETAILSRNTNLLLSKVATEQAIIQHQLNKGARAPSISMNASYGYTNAENGAGIILSQQNQGLNAGLNLSVPIFQGRRLHRAIENAETDLQSAEIRNQSNELNLSATYRRLLLQESELLQTLSIVQENQKLATLAMERAERAYSLGQIGFTDFRQSQLSFLAAQVSKLETEIQLVKLSYQFKQLAGELI